MNAVQPGLSSKLAKHLPAASLRKCALPLKTTKPPQPSRWHSSLHAVKSLASMLPALLAEVMSFPSKMRKLPKSIAAGMTVALEAPDAAPVGKRATTAFAVAPDVADATPSGTLPTTSLAVTLPVASVVIGTFVANSGFSAFVWGLPVTVAPMPGSTDDPNDCRASSTDDPTDGRQRSSAK